MRRVSGTASFTLALSLCLCMTAIAVTSGESEVPPAPETAGGGGGGSGVSSSGPDASTEREPVSVRTLLSHGSALVGVKNKRRVMFEVHTAEIKKRLGARPAYELSVVLDISGSMSGSKLDQAKEAIKDIIRGLDERDILHLVAYSDEAQIVFLDGKASDSTSLLSQVDAIQDLGATCISCGLDKGFNVLSVNRKDGKLAATDNIRRIPRIFLFSDGLANVGITEHEAIFALARQLHNKGTSVTTFGIGADFDQRMMQGIAEYGAGEYFYIASSHDIPRFVGHAMKSVGALVGANAILHVRGLNGAVVTSARGYPDEGLVEGFNLGDLRQGDLKRVMIDLEYQPSDSVGSVVDVLKWELKYKSLLVEHTDEERKLEGLVQTTLTDDADKAAEVDTEVKIYEDMELLLEKQREAKEKLQSGDREGWKKASIDAFEYGTQTLHAAPASLKAKGRVGSQYAELVRRHADNQAKVLSGESNEEEAAKEYDHANYHMNRYSMYNDEL